MEKLMYIFGYIIHCFKDFGEFIVDDFTNNYGVNLTAGIGGITLSVINTVTFDWTPVWKACLYGFVGGMGAILGRMITLYIWKELSRKIDMYKYKNYSNKNKHGK